MVHSAISECHSHGIETLVTRVKCSGWNKFQPQIDPVQDRGTFLWTVISKTCPRMVRSKIVLLHRISNISVTCPHAQATGRTVIKKLWIFFGPWGWDRSQTPPCWIFRVKQIHQSLYECSNQTMLHLQLCKHHCIQERLQICSRGVSTSA